MHPQVDALLSAPDEAVSVATLNTVHDLLRFATWEPELLKQTAQRLLSLLAAAPAPAHRDALGLAIVDALTRTDGPEDLDFAPLFAAMARSNDPAFLGTGLRCIAATYSRAHAPAVAAYLTHEHEAVRARARGLTPAAPSGRFGRRPRHAWIHGS